METGIPLLPEEARVDPATGLPRHSVALTDLARMINQRQDPACIGVVSLAVQPEPALMRLAIEADRILRMEITRRLSAALRPQDRLYVADHWEWLVVLAKLPSSAPLMMAMIRFDTLFATPLVTEDGLKFSVNIVSGGALCPDDGGDARHLVQSARIARIVAERSGTPYTAYEPAMEHVDKSQSHLHVELPRALAGAPGLALYLQPQIDLKTKVCVGCEALLRWRLPDGERVPPNQTLAAVERLGLRASFTRWLLQQASQIQHRLREEQIPIVLSINLAANDLRDVELPDLIAQISSTWDIVPGSLLLELTETTMIEDTELVIQVLRRLRDLGFHLSVDDFGTGYASMSYLQRLPVQEVKIDQSFVRFAEASDRDREIIDSVVRLAHRLGMLVVAEGVENAGIETIVAELGCDRGQGYHYSPALELDEFIQWWRARASDAEAAAT